MSRYVDKQGYVRKYSPQNVCSDPKGYIYEHREKMSDTLKNNDPDHPAIDSRGCIRSTWMVHHKDEDKSNNSEHNLVVQKNFRHKQHHFTVNNPHPKERDALGRFI